MTDRSIPETGESGMAKERSPLFHGRNCDGNIYCPTRYTNNRLAQKIRQAGLRIC